MESVKSALASALLKEFGPGCIVELETIDRCMKLSLPVSRDHVVYVRPDNYEKHFLCHYAHVADLSAFEDEKNGDMLAFKQQNVAQLPMRVKGSLREFVPATMWYARLAAARMGIMKGMGDGRRLSPRLETFKEIKARLYHYPEPK